MAAQKCLGITGLAAFTMTALRRRNVCVTPKNVCTGNKGLQSVLETVGTDLEYTEYLESFVQ